MRVWVIVVAVMVAGVAKAQSQRLMTGVREAARERAITDAAEAARREAKLLEPMGTILRQPSTRPTTIDMGAVASAERSLRDATEAAKTNFDKGAGALKLAETERAIAELERARAGSDAQAKLDASAKANKLRGELATMRKAAVSADSGVVSAKERVGVERAKADEMRAKALADSRAAESAARIFDEKYLKAWIPDSPKIGDAGTNSRIMEVEQILGDGVMILRWWDNREWHSWHYKGWKTKGLADNQKVVVDCPVIATGTIKIAGSTYMTISPLTAESVKAVSP